MKLNNKFFWKIIWFFLAFSYFYIILLFYHNIKLYQNYKLLIDTTFNKGFQFTCDFFGYKYIGYSNEFIDQNILIYGAYEKYVLFFMRNVIQRSNDMNIVFFDIGAHAGQHSLFMSQYISTIHAFEPYPPLVTRFTEMININKIKNIFLHPVGLGDRNESIPFYEPPLRNTGVGSFMNKWYARNEEILINLEIVKGDDLPQEILAKIDLIKLDTEGYEKNIIKGMRNSLHTNRPIVVMELNVGGEQMWKSEGDIYSTYPSNYKILYLEPLDSPSSGKYRLSRFDFDFSLPRNIEKPEDHPNIVLYPSEKETLILSIAL